MLTKSGVGALITGLIGVVCGWWWHYPELIAVGAGLVALVAVSVVAVRTRQPARVERSVPTPRVARGSAVDVEYFVDNPTRRRSPALTIIDQLCDLRTSTAVPSLTRHERTTLWAQLPTPHRGIFPIGPGWLERVDLFQLAVGRRAELGTAEVVVHPRVWPIEGPFGALHATSEDAQTRSFASDPLSGFVSLRPYVDGDDPRLIHWPTTARTGDLMVREHVELRRPEFTVIVDADRGVATPADFEEMVDVAASLAVHAIQTGFRVRLATTNPERLSAAVPFDRDSQVLDFLTPITQVDPIANLNVGQVVHRAGTFGTIAFVTGPAGPSSRLGEMDNVAVIRIGADAKRTAGITAAATSAPEFAQGWR